MIKKFNIEDYIGKKYHKLTVLRESTPNYNKKRGNKIRMVICECECGNITKPIRLTSIKTGKTKSCGCLKIERTIEVMKSKRKFNVQIGDRFGTLVVTSFKEQRYNVECLCDCGVTKRSTYSKLHSGNVRCSSCSKKPRKLKEAKGKYDRLTIIREVEQTKPKERRVLVECECGKQFETNLYSIKSGNTKSCGCLKIERTIQSRTFHGDSQRVSKGVEREYIAWKAMKQRCFNPNGQFYYLYGGRGITVCDRWLEPNGQGYMNFLNDMGRKPSREHSIDRIDVDGNYEPSNCRWATPKEQRNNQRVNR